MPCPISVFRIDDHKTETKKTYGKYDIYFRKKKEQNEK